MCSKAIERLVMISKYVGERYDLVQAGGGNTSVKLDNNKMLIKASGYLLSEMNKDIGYSEVDIVKVNDFLMDIETKELTKDERETLASEAMAYAIISGPRASIETFLHSVLKKYTVHVHPIVINALGSSKQWKTLLEQVNESALFVEYETPGIELALKMNAAIRAYESLNNARPDVIFLKNHGLIVTSDSEEEVLEILEKQINEAEKLLTLDLSKYKLTNQVSSLFKEVFDKEFTSYLSDDEWLVKEVYAKKDDLCDCKPINPDGLVYCGYSAVELNCDEDKNKILDYYKKYGEMPKVVLYKNHVFFVADDLKKAKLIEDVFKSNIIILAERKDDIDVLPIEEIEYLSNWEAEKYRQNK